MENENTRHPIAEELHNEFWGTLARRVYSSPDGINCLTTDEKTFFAVRLFQAEVYNGGIDQFFFNSSGDYYKEVVIGLKTLGANQTCGLLMLATRLIFARKAPSVDCNNRLEALDSPRARRWSDAVDVLETAMDDSTDNLPGKLAAFVDEKKLIPARPIAIS